MLQSTPSPGSQCPKILHGFLGLINQLPCAQTKQEASAPWCSLLLQCPLTASCDLHCPQGLQNLWTLLFTFALMKPIPSKIRCSLIWPLNDFSPLLEKKIMFLLIIVFNKLQQYLCAAYPKEYILHDCKWNGMFSMVCHVYLFQMSNWMEYLLNEICFQSFYKYFLSPNYSSWLLYVGPDQ